MNKQRLESKVTVFDVCNWSVFLDDTHAWVIIFRLSHDYSDRADREYSSPLEIA